MAEATGNAQLVIERLLSVSGSTIPDPGTGAHGAGRVNQVMAEACEITPTKLGGVIPGYLVKPLKAVPGTRTVFIHAAMVYAVMK